MRVVPLLVICSCTSTSFWGAGSDASLVQRSVADVNAVAGCQWLDVDESGTEVISSNKELRTCADNVLGFYDYVRNEIVLREPDQYNSVSRSQVLLHEMGHAVGLDHQPGVMEASFRPMSHDEAIRSLVSTAQKHGLLRCPDRSKM